MKKLEKKSKNIVELLIENGLKAVSQLWQSGTAKITVRDKYNNMVRVDVEFKDGQEIAGRVRNLQELLAEKFNIVMMQADRHFKNIVDVIICIHVEFVNGVSK